MAEVAEDTNFSPGTMKGAGAAMEEPEVGEQQGRLKILTCDIDLHLA